MSWISSDLRAMAPRVFLPVLSVEGRTPGMRSWPEIMILGGSRCMMGLRAGCGWREYSNWVPSIADNTAFTVNKRVKAHIVWINQKAYLNAFPSSSMFSTTFWQCIITTIIQHCQSIVKLISSHPFLHFSILDVAKLTAKQNKGLLLNLSMNI